MRLTGKDAAFQESGKSCHEEPQSNAPRFPLVRNRAPLFSYPYLHAAPAMRDQQRVRLAGDMKHRRSRRLGGHTMLAARGKRARNALVASIGTPFFHCRFSNQRMRHLLYLEKTPVASVTFLSTDGGRDRSRRKAGNRTLVKG